MRTGLRAFRPCLLVILLVLRPTATAIAQGPPPSPPVPGLTEAWRADDAWADGRVESAIYAATCNVDGARRHYEARIDIHRALADPDTKTLSTTDRGRGIFKYHLREEMPATGGVVHRSTMCYVGHNDLKSLKIDAAVLEPRGVTFKQLVSHAGQVTWDQHSYLPGEGQRSGAYAPPGNLMFFDALPLILRGYPFDAAPALEIMLLPRQASAQWTPVEPAAAKITLVGQETLDLPIGKVDAWHVRLTIPPAAGASADTSPEVHDYWIHADGAAPSLHVMVQYRGPDGASMQLQRLSRSE